jgi:hypothetical protein
VVILRGWLTKVFLHSLLWRSSAVIAVAVVGALSALTGSAEALDPQPADQTSRAFFTATLNGLGLPVTGDNLDALYSVEHVEGDSDRYNPLNVVQPEPGSVSYNSVGVQRYANYPSGVAGTVTLLGNPHWAGVRRALASGSSVAAVLAAFSDAYTWSSDASFPTGATIWDAEAIRDVGGPYSDPVLAAQRAAGEQATVDGAAAPSLAVIDSSHQASVTAHADWATQRATQVTASAQRASHAAAAAAARAQVEAVTASVRAIMVADYEGSSVMPSALALLTAPTPQGLLSVNQMQRYLDGIGASTVSDFAKWQQLATSEQRQADAQAAIATAAGNAMAADQRAWVAADSRTATAAATLTASLGAIERDSIMTAEADRIVAALP